MLLCIHCTSSSLTCMGQMLGAYCAAASCALQRPCLLIKLAANASSICPSSVYRPYPLGELWYVESCLEAADNVLCAPALNAAPQCISAQGTQYASLHFVCMIAAWVQILLSTASDRHAAGPATCQAPSRQCGRVHEPFCCKDMQLVSAWVAW